ncbi:MAG: hypothetical protein WD068_00415, partial [Candidatus Babeliales bacterium]
MKSVIEEASTIAKAVEKGWEKAGKPIEFTVKILEQPEYNFLGLSKSLAKVGIFFSAKDIKSEEKPVTAYQKPQQQQRRPQQKSRDQQAPRRDRRDDRPYNRQENRELSRRDEPSHN